MKFPPKYRLSLLWLLVFVISACSTKMETPLNQQSQADWSLYQLQAGRINQWHLRGRTAIFVDDEVHNIGLNWQRDEDQFVMVLEAPLGQGVIRVETSNEQNLPIKLSLPDGEVIYGEDTEATLYRILGWSIPVEGLTSWIKGLPLRSVPFSQQLNGDGRLKSLAQNGWHINYLDYFDIDSPAQGLPRKLYLKHERLALKIVIEHWQRSESVSSSPELFPDFN